MEGIACDSAFNGGHKLKSQLVCAVIQRPRLVTEVSLPSRESDRFKIIIKHSINLRLHVLRDFFFFFILNGSEGVVGCLKDKRT